MNKIKSKNEELISVLRMKNSYEILKELESGCKRFKDLKRKFTHSTLAKRLSDLEKYNLIIRKVDEKRKPPVVEYELTEKGRKILDFFKKIVEEKEV
jgi:DNA-binding HxlR family transcriptional regulator